MHQTPKTFAIYKSIDAALTKVYETLGASRVKTATYGVPTAASSATDQLTPTDLLTQATWVDAVVRASLSDVQRAFVTCAYDGMGTARDASLATLVDANPTIHHNSTVVRELFIREFDFGETYCKAQKQIAIEANVSLSTVEKAASRTRKIAKELRREVDATLTDVFAQKGWIAQRANAA